MLAYNVLERTNKCCSHISYIHTSRDFPRVSMSVSSLLLCSNLYLQSHIIQILVCQYYIVQNKG